jgi:hypothetical protein
MGRWGDDIFDSDSVLDFIAPLQASLLWRVVFYLADESLSDEWSDGIAYGADPVVASIEILCLLCDHADLRFVKEKRVVRRWREVCLERFENDTTWDNAQTPDGLDARVERRKVIEATFDRLEALTDDE